jgi:hypothetical protein
MARGGRAMDQGPQRVVGRPGLVSRRQGLRVNRSEHRAVSVLVHGDFDLHEAGDAGDHAVEIAAFSGDAHELSLSEGLQHPATRLLV